MEVLWQDLRFAIRSLRKQRGTTLIALICLALGIGANAAIFSVVHTVLLSTLPYRDPGQLVRVYETWNFQGTRATGSVSVPNLLDWRAQNTVFEGLAGYTVNSLDLGGGVPERVRGVRTTANLFEVLGSSPQLGRTFATDEDQPGRNPVVVLGDGFWRRRFGADPAIVGQTILLDNEARTVIGVMPSDFDYPIGSIRTDVWVPLIWNERQASRGNHWLSVVARLKPAADSASATTNMLGISRQLAEAYPDQQGDRSVQINSMNGIVTGRVRKPLTMLLGAVGLVLLIACANVANLLLARASSRRREVAIRTALGAERMRIVRQLLTESMLLALTGGLLGLAVAHWGLRAILTLAASSLPRGASIGLNVQVMAFAMLISMVTGLVFGVLPALRMSRPSREDLADSAGRSGTGRQQHRTLNTLMIGEIAVSLVLLIGAGLLVRGFSALVSIDPGLKPENVLTFHVSAPAGRFADSARFTGFYGPLLERLRAIPGVRTAASTTMLPIQNAGWNGNFTIVGRPQETDPAKQPFAEYRVVSSGYFQTLGIQIKAGREFTDDDRAGATPVIIINDEFARRNFPNEDPLGKQIFPWTPQPATIVGVVSSVRQVSLEQEARSELYVPAAQTPWQLTDVTYILSTTASPESYTNAVRAAVRELGPDQPIYLVTPMERVIADSLRGRKLTLSLLAVFAGLAVLLSAAGVYGVMSYGVSQRRREIGIRMALGARGTDVTSMILKGAARLAGIGTVIGLGAALGLTQVLDTMLYRVGARDPATFVAVAFVIVAMSLLASAVPALRAARVEPIAAMRID